MKISEFTRDEDFDFQLYSWDDVIETEIGEFEVEIQIMDDSPLSEDLVNLAAKLSEEGKANCKKLLDVIYQSYKECDEFTMMDFDGPQDLTIEQIKDYIESMSFVIVKDPDGEREVDSYIQIQPEWDEEHGLYIRCQGGSLEVFDPMS